MSDNVEQLQIIAADAKGLSSVDRAIIAQAAADLKAAHDDMGMMGMHLTEARARLIALRDQLIDRNRDLIHANGELARLRNEFAKLRASPSTSLPWSMGTGMLPARDNDAG